MTPMTHNVHAKIMKPLPSPSELRKQFSVSADVYKKIASHRQTVIDILTGKDDRLLLCIGPCALRNYSESLEYGTWLAKMQQKHPNFFFVMRCCVDKPRTTTGWPGLALDPYFDETYDMAKGISLSREIYAGEANIDVPITLEVFDPTIIHSLSDLVTHSWVGARSVSHGRQAHIASTLSMPVGFKNSLDGSIDLAADAAFTARKRHAFPGPDDDGRIAPIYGSGNPCTHVILRGKYILETKTHVSNYDRTRVKEAIEAMAKRDLMPAILVDTNHSNSGKKPEKQRDVALDAIRQRKGGTAALRGLLIESDIESGRQDIPAPHMMNAWVNRSKKSFTDACLGIPETEDLLAEMDVMFSSSHQPQPVLT
jgi:3-deoxy-7-phosphoheptulonate synthase